MTVANFNNTKLYESKIRPNNSYVKHRIHLIPKPKASINDSLASRKNLIG